MQLLEKGTVLTSAAFLDGDTARSDRGTRWGQCFLEPRSRILTLRCRLADRDGDSLLLACSTRGRYSCSKRGQSLPQRDSRAVAPRARIAERDGDSLFLARSHRSRCNCSKRGQSFPQPHSCVVTPCARLVNRDGDSLLLACSRRSRCSCSKRGQSSPLRLESRTDPEGDSPFISGAPSPRCRSVGLQVEEGTVLSRRSLMPAARIQEVTVLCVDVPRRRLRGRDGSSDAPRLAQLNSSALMVSASTSQSFAWCAGGFQPAPHPSHWIASCIRQLKSPKWNSRWLGRSGSGSSSR